jgi:2-(1,2-epoxy-1,2-dihydrophenyl)acetyl-CoA isomerase
MSFKTILFAEAAGCYRLTFNRPERLNAFTAEMHGEAAEAVRRVATDPGARVLLITGAGRAFCAGQDLGERNVGEGPLDLGDALDRHYNPLIRQLAALPVPVVCAVNGAAAGAGVNLAAVCDITIAKRSAKFVQAFASIGLVPDAGGSWHLPRLMGQARALGFALLGETLTAEHAEAMGLIWKAVDDDDFEREVEALVGKLTYGPTFGLASTKRLIRAAWTSTLDEALDAERDAQRRCGLSPDYTEGVTAFKAKRAPEFTGQRPRRGVPTD